MATVLDRVRSRGSCWRAYRGRSLKVWCGEPESGSKALFLTAAVGFTYRKTATRTRFAEFIDTRASTNSRTMTALSTRRRNVCCSSFVAGSEINIAQFSPRLVEFTRAPRKPTCLGFAPYCGAFPSRRALGGDSVSLSLTTTMESSSASLHWATRYSTRGRGISGSDGTTDSVNGGSSTSWTSSYWSVPPYNELLCGKLIALLAASNEVRETVQEALPWAADRHPRSVERSELSPLDYNLCPRAVISVQPDQGGHSMGLPEARIHGRLGAFPFEQRHLRCHEALPPCNRSPGRFEAHRYGNGPNWRIRVARTCLRDIALSPLASLPLLHSASCTPYHSPLTSPSSFTARPT